MNKTEKKAFDWFLKEGIPENVIVFQYRKNPDFIFTDREVKYEVKRLYGKKILLRKHQHEILQELDGDIFYLVFKDELEEPVAKIPVSEVKTGDERCRGVLIHWVEVPEKETIITRAIFSLPEEHIGWIDKKVKEGKFKDRNHAIRIAVGRLIKEEEASAL